MDSWLKEVMIGISGLIYTFDPPCVVLGGGIMSQPYIINSLNEMLPQYVMPLYAKTKLIPAQVGNYTGLLGVGYLASVM